MLRRCVALGSLCALLALASCRDVSSFSTNGGSYSGAVVQSSFVLAGVDPSTTLCMTLDTDHLQDTPGLVSTSDGRFAAVPFRPIPQIWQDPLSTLNFGDGRVRNLVYVASATTSYADGAGDDVFFVVSLMTSGDVEVRLLRGAPPLASEAGAPAGTPTSVFAIFDLKRQSSPCSY